MSWDDDNNEENIEEPKQIVNSKLDKQFSTQFKFVESTEEGKEVYTIFGNKGDGKSVLALSFPSTICALSFDRKTEIIKKYFYKNEDRIKVYNAVEHLSEDVDNYTYSSLITYNYIKFLLKNIKIINPDWVLIDGLEIFSGICEMVMRYNHKLSPFQGVANLNLWKERRLMMREVHRLADESCKKGIIYTTYTDKEEIVEEGTIKSKTKVPKWTDVVLWHTDFVIHTYSKAEKDGRKFYYDVVSSKNDNRLKTGSVIDVTQKRIKLGD